MFEYLTHYYKQGDVPLRSLSALPNSEALIIMESLYEDNPLAERFKQPNIMVKSLLFPKSTF